MLKSEDTTNSLIKLNDSQVDKLSPNENIAIWSARSLCLPLKMRNYNVAPDRNFLKMIFASRLIFASNLNSDANLNKNRYEIMLHPNFLYHSIKRNFKIDKYDNCTMIKFIVIFIRCLLHYHFKNN